MLRLNIFPQLDKLSVPTLHLHHIIDNHGPLLQLNTLQDFVLPQQYIEAKIHSIF